MLRSIKELIGYNIRGKDDYIGLTTDFYFDDLHWVIRYLVADVGVWQPNRKVLLSPYVIKNTEWETSEIEIRLTKAQVENSPEVDTDKPVSRQQETDLVDYFKWPIYWSVKGIAGETAAETLVNMSANEEAGNEEADYDSHLRSVNEVLGYQVEAKNGAVGYIDDLIIDLQQWTINYLVIDTGSLLSSKTVLVAASWIDEFAWSVSKVFVNLTKESIEEGPEYSPNTPINSDLKQQLYDFHGRPH